MKKKINMSLATVALLTGLLFSGCTSNTGQEGMHTMGSAPMGNQKMPGKIPAQ